MKIRIKRNPLDKLFSDYIRAKAGWKCERCGNVPDRRGLHCHHFQRRRKQSTRFDEDNCLSLCLGCHQFFQENDEEEKFFMVQKLGQERFDMLLVRARTLTKYVDKSAIELYLRAKIQELKGG